MEIKEEHRSMLSPRLCTSMGKGKVFTRKAKKNVRLKIVDLFCGARTTEQKGKYVMRLPHYFINVGRVVNSYWKSREGRQIPHIPREGIVNSLTSNPLKISEIIHFKGL